ncbi:preprotein translocase subunit YajC [Nocardioides sp. GY 10127]|uniref:preprotein translocase subunit YajC n=1 Tax=Nocardioides sp. GY 10127 TaxID=2569762 RepID=UPI001457EF6B|nr:preprotein translocase subunit YajC [Nocardioides sp. GY 10127]
MELLLPILLVVVFWLFLIRPQQRRAKETAAMQRSLEPGDEVMLTAGLFGTVVSIDDDRIQVELSPGTVVTVARGAIGQVVPPQVEEAEDETGDQTGDETPASGDTADTDPTTGSTPGSDDKES